MIWQPSKFTPPLPGNEDLASSGGHWLIEFVERYVRLESGEPVRLADYEKFILLHALEIYPDTWHVEHRRGKLRNRAYLLSVARRNHKTSLAAYITFYVLLRHAPGSMAYLVGPQREHAETAYRYVFNAVNQSPALFKRIKPSKYRGVRLRKGTGEIRILTGEEDKMQGKGFLNGIWLLDEAHLMDPEVYAAAVASMRHTQDGMILALSTAGDVDSHLYKSLYQQAERAIAGDEERFGAIILEGNEDAPLDDVESIKAANPAIDAGYFSLETALAEARDVTVADSKKRRYLHNNQINVRTEPWVPIEDWNAGKANGVTEKTNLVYSIDVTPGMGYGSFSVSRKAGDDFETQMVASVVGPDIDRLERICDRLVAENGYGSFAMDTYLLGDLANRLERKNFTVYKLRQTENVRAAGMLYGYIKQHRVKHNGDAVIKNQMQDARRKNVSNGSGFRIVRGNEDIDSVMSMVYGVYAASIHEERFLGF